MPHNYAIEIIYSDEDEGFIAVVPERPGCSAFGGTEEEVLREVKVAVSLRLEVAREKGRTSPELAPCRRAPGHPCQGGRHGCEYPPLSGRTCNRDPAERSRAAGGRFSDAPRTN